MHLHQILPNVNNQVIYPSGDVIIGRYYYARVNASTTNTLSSSGNTMTSNVNVNHLVISWN